MPKAVGIENDVRDRRVAAGLVPAGSGDPCRPVEGGGRRDRVGEARPFDVGGPGVGLGDGVPGRGPLPAPWHRRGSPFVGLAAGRHPRPILASLGRRPHSALSRGTVGARHDPARWPLAGRGPRRAERLRPDPVSGHGNLRPGGRSARLRAGPLIGHPPDRLRPVEPIGPGAPQGPHHPHGRGAPVAIERSRRQPRGGPRIDRPGLLAAPRRPLGGGDCIRPRPGIGLGQRGRRDRSIGGSAARRVPAPVNASTS